jgi:hypothetical protein
VIVKTCFRHIIYDKPPYHHRPRGKLKNANNTWAGKS